MCAAARSELITKPSVFECWMTLNVTSGHRGHGGLVTEQKFIFNEVIQVFQNKKPTRDLRNYVTFGE